jgi:hypothetical protein
MKAIVCDCCGKVILIPEEEYIYGLTGVHHLVSNTLDKRELDLCDDCAEKLMKAVRDK